MGRWLPWAALALLVLAVAWKPWNAGQPPRFVWVCVQVPPAEEPVKEAEGPREFPRSRLLYGEGGPAGARVRILSAGFVAAGDPQVTWDGRLLFAARRGEGDPWRLWELRLPRGPLRPIGPAEGEAREPCQLPGEVLVYVARGPWGSWSLWRWSEEGGKPEVLTATPDDALHPVPLRDGRLLFLLRRPGRGGDWFTLWPDGTGLTLFTEGSASSCSPAQETLEESERSILFSAGGRLVLVALKRPLALRQEVDSLPGVVESAAPLPDGRWLLAYRPPQERSFGLYLFNPRRQSLEGKVYDDPQWDEIRPLWVGPRPRPKRLLSVVYLKKGVTTGRVYCLDARSNGLSPSPPPPASRVRFWQGVPTPQGMEERLLGETSLKEDGSFFVEVPADVPLRLETLDLEGRTVQRQDTWIWVRPNENRACIGCHESPEIAPENTVPQAITQAPVPLKPGEAKAP